MASSNPNTGTALHNRKWLVLLGDLVAIAFFWLLGLATHQEGLSAASFARAALPFMIAWLAIGGLLGAFQPRDTGLAQSIIRIAVAWVISGLIALAARSLIFDRELITAFFFVSLFGYGMFIIGWRLLLAKFGSQGYYG